MSTETSSPTEFATDQLVRYYRNGWHYGRVSLVGKFEVSIKDFRGREVWARFEDVQAIA